MLQLVGNRGVRSVPGRTHAVEILGPFYWSPSGTESAKYCQVYGDISEFEEAVSQSEYSSVFHRLKKWY